jgi:hypothetical protein
MASCQPPKKGKQQNPEGIPEELRGCHPRRSRNQRGKAQKTESEILDAIARQRGVSRKEARRWMQANTPAR